MLMMKIEMFHVRSVAATFLPLSTVRPLSGRLRFRLRPMSSWLCLAGFVQPLVFQLLLSLQPLFGHSGRSRCCLHHRFFNCIVWSSTLLLSLLVCMFGAIFRLSARIDSLSVVRLPVHSGCRFGRPVLSSSFLFGPSGCVAIDLYVFGQALFGRVVSVCLRPFGPFVRLFVWSKLSGCLIPCLSGAVGFSSCRCLVCVYISFSVFFFGPSVLTDSGSSSDSLCVASSGHCEHFRFWSRAFSAHPAGLCSTHCVFLRSLLVGVSFRSCWHRFPSIRSFCVWFFLHTHHLPQHAFLHTHVVANRTFAHCRFHSRTLT